MAAEQLASEGYDFRVAGNVSDEVRNHPMMRHLNFLGRVPREEMREEFLKADVFVLPTLAEGCASVVHEAVMAGCPVITTRASGTMVEDGRGGVIVPERDPMPWQRRYKVSFRTEAKEMNWQHPVTTWRRHLRKTAGQSA